MWWLAADLHRSALSGDQLILVVKRVCSRVRSQLRIGLSICWLPTYDDSGPARERYLGGKFSQEIC